MAGLLTFAGCAATATALAGDPSGNVAESMPASCSAAGTSSGCTQAAIAQLDAARAGEGEGPYRLPRDFLQLSGAHQIIVLTNLDRAAAGLRPVPGATPSLDRAAMTGARLDADPVLSDPGLSWASNWAGNFPDAIWAYLTWMYDDGPGGPNVDCPGPGAPGCWDHRHNILARFPPGGTLEMGAADLADRSYTMVIAQASAGAPVHYDFRAPVADQPAAGVRRRSGLPSS